MNGKVAELALWLKQNSLRARDSELRKKPAVNGKPLDLIGIDDIDRPVGFEGQRSWTSQSSRWRPPTSPLPHQAGVLLASLGTSTRSAPGQSLHCPHARSESDSKQDAAVEVFAEPVPRVDVA
jgi:hypothetical protein